MSPDLEQSDGRPITPRRPTRGDAQEEFLRTGRKRRIDSSDIREWGALFSELDDSHPAQIDPRDVEDTANLDQPQGEGLPSAASSPASMPERGTASPRPQLSPVIEYLNANPFLPLSELPEFRRQRSYRTIRSPRGRSPSSQSTPSSDYQSAQDHSPRSETEITHDAGTRPPSERPPTPYFTPSHTPSHRSLETSTEEDDDEGRAPDSPQPRSNFYPYDARYGVNAVQRID